MITEINGHTVTRTTTDGVYHCPGCNTTTGYHSFDSGIEGCPGRPESLNYLSVDSGGDDLGTRAARQYLDYADRIGMKTSAWAQSMAAGVGAEGGVVAEFTMAGASYAVHVSATGKITAARTWPPVFHVEPSD